MSGPTASGWIPWADIARFAVEPAGPYPYVGRLIRKDGKPGVTIVGTGTGTRDTKYNRRTAQKPIDLLNKRLEQWRAEQERAVVPADQGAGGGV
jgi:50S ribosomal subunit-associated GTPase HflX